MLYIDNIRADERYDKIKDQIGRRKAAKYSLRSELIENVINRIEEESDPTIDFDEFMEFFTRRGRPLHILKKIEVNQDELINAAMNMDPKYFGMQTDKQLSKNAPNRAGYDSDLEFHTKIKEIDYQYKNGNFRNFDIVFN